jgi:hypothetical protein
MLQLSVLDLMLFSSAAGSPLAYYVGKYLRRKDPAGTHGLEEVHIIYKILPGNGIGSSIIQYQSGLIISLEGNGSPAVYYGSCRSNNI